MEKTIKDYDIDPNIGFLLKSPTKNLPDYFKPWQHLVDDLAPLYEKKLLRSEILQMPILDHKKIKSHRELRLAKLQLSLLASGYVWQGGDKDVPKKIPECISIPLFGISEELGVQPILSHLDLVLANWCVSDELGSRPCDVEDLQCLYHLPGGSSADWFVLATVKCELVFAPAIQIIWDAVRLAADQEEENLYKKLQSLSQILIQLKLALSRLHDGVDPNIFYNVLRPILSGWGGASSPIPEGIVYEGVSDKPFKMIGGSAAQSSTLQLVDAALSVQHDPEIQTFFNSMRSHMPVKHRQLIEDISKHTKIRELATASSCHQLITSYNECIQVLVNIRSYHIQVVTKYIIIQSNLKDRVNEYKSVSKQGTGGSSLLPFLRQAREATKQCVIPPQPR